MAGPMASGEGGPRGRGRGGLGGGPCRGPRGGRGPGPSEEGSVGIPAGGGGRYRRSILEVAILATLAETTSHGYDLVDHLEALAADLVCVDAGSMYRLLRAMEEDGLVTSSWQTPESGPSRRMYVITDRGREVLELMAHALAQRAAAMQELADHAKTVARKSQAPAPQGAPSAEGASSTPNQPSPATGPPAPSD
jgi:PadR family transcriptional regulator PadR